ncbi:FusB/FusC family EF-G-binding protein [Jeotgalibacillus proteolyticus]|uniref:Elongation factor G-binding protein n=1 Tax=Jeotgalibacillus proteolyticus TaxID=2082395 RepID=A0A2S5GCM6_9BACL|nr:FusB/FusC family EF-G-binding protein [Jeotgalibacillus proteolyticus]PPA70671.1 elongation factor G-binding protein [Jeotgalibacillus proteolyticus]
MEPFIQNHQFNVIKHQATLLQKQVHGTIDRDVEEAVRAGTEWNVKDAFCELSEEQEELLSRVSDLRTEEDRVEFLKELHPYRLSFPDLTQRDVKELFPKTKRLKLPILKDVDFTATTYLGWKDIGASRHYMICLINGKLIGVEGRYVISTKKSMCEICGRYGDVAFMSVPKQRTSEENEKAFGKFVCYDSRECNQYIQKKDKLEQFIEQIID